MLGVVSTLTKGAGKPAGGMGVVEEKEVVVVPGKEDGWLEVGRRNKTVVTRTVRTFFLPMSMVLMDGRRSRVPSLR